MARLIKTKEIKEGDFFCRWLRSRLINNNQNVLGVELGATGSGKSYRDLRKAELWYKFQFNEPVPIDNICFGILNVMKRIKYLSEVKKRKGEIIIFEEAGANLGNLDFQNRICKMFTYVLQSFRSFNIAIFFNLPFFTMLNKSARMLMHYSFESAGIDRKKKINKCRPFFHQVNQKSGKIYKKFPKTRKGGRKTKIKGFEFQMPSKYLKDAYESKKQEYLLTTTDEYIAKMEEIELKENHRPTSRKPLTELQEKILECWKKGMIQKDIVIKLGRAQKIISESEKYMNNKGYYRDRALKSGNNLLKPI